jgi:hypothetical protein
VLRDCLEHPQAVRELYDLTVQTIELKRKSYFGFLMSYPSSVLRSSVELMQLFVGQLKLLRGMAEALAPRFTSRGFSALFCDAFRVNSADDYFAIIESQLRETEVRPRRAAQRAARQGQPGHESHAAADADKRPLLAAAAAGPPRTRIRLPPARARRGRRAHPLGAAGTAGLNTAANALAQSAEMC